MNSRRVSMMELATYIDYDNVTTKKFTQNL